MTDFDRQPTLIGTDGEPRPLNGSVHPEVLPMRVSHAGLSPALKTWLSVITALLIVCTVILVMVVVKYLQIKHGLQDIGDTFNSINLDPSPTPPCIPGLDPDLACPTP